MVVVTMRGRWTIKRKEKEKKKRREGGRRSKGPLEKRLGGPRVSLYTEPYIPMRNQARCRETIWWWLGVWAGGVYELVHRLSSFRCNL